MTYLLIQQHISIRNGRESSGGGVRGGGGGGGVV